MADLAADTILKTAPHPGTYSYPIADGVTIPAGALVQTQSGYLNHWDETGEFVGVFIGGTDRAGDGVFTGETSDSPPPEGIVDESGVILTHLDSVAGTPAQSKVGDLVYSADSDPASLTLTDTTNPPVGWLKRFRSTTDVDVQLFTPGEWHAGNAGATWAS